MYLYHGTNTQRLSTIKKEGLDPKAPKASSGDNFVYLTDSPHIAARFSGFGQDMFGMIREGYMASDEHKKNTGVVLKIKVPNPKKLKPDAIWKKKLKEMDGKDAYKKSYDEVMNDIDNGELDWHFEDLMYKMLKKSPDYEDDVDLYMQHPPEEIVESVRHQLADKYAKKSQKAVEDELKFFEQGKLFQYPDHIGPENIEEVIPAKKFLGKTSEERPFGNEYKTYASFKKAVAAKYEIIS